jgi:hypothetical protein
MNQGLECAGSFRCSGFFYIWRFLNPKNNLQKSSSGTDAYHNARPIGLFRSAIKSVFSVWWYTFNPNRSLGFYEGGGTGQEHLGFVLQLNRLFPADLADFRRNWCLSSIV